MNTSRAATRHHRILIILYHLSYESKKIHRHDNYVSPPASDQEEACENENEQPKERDRTPKNILITKYCTCARVISCDFSFIL